MAIQGPPTIPNLPLYGRPSIVRVTYSCPGSFIAAAARIELKEYAACRRVLPFKYRPVVAHCGHHRDAADRNWFLALSAPGPRYINRTTHSLRHPRQVMVSRLQS
jgi:hypothetical protein